MSNPLISECITVMANNSVAKKNKRGETLQPCLMPPSTLNLEHVPSERETQLLLSVYNIAIISRNVLPGSKCLNMLITEACSIEWNALWKSRNNMKPSSLIR